ncbi:MAG: hypothetical protein GF346_04210, partial [Candidatus Eisenbacteria bacterium]|nr:hypothetical protein [Candidatus Latescibacterota bacterium]MBD3301630.1 hypothetical protein [Candidatus Eisenbacteria bacterium]
ALPRRTRHGAAISALAAGGDWEGFERQARWALDERVALPWLREVMLQAYLFIGYPRAIQALQILTRCGPEEEQGQFWTDAARRPEWGPRGRNLCERIYGPQFRPLLSVMRRTHPELAEWMIREGYGKVLSRPFLGAKVRELCVVSLLTAQRSWPQLEAHLSGALRVGATHATLAEAVETGAQMAPETEKSRALRLVQKARP